MEDRTLTSELYNNIKFNMQKLVFDVAEGDVERLSQIMGASATECRLLMAGFEASIAQIAEGSMKNKPKAAKSARLAFIGDSLTSDRESFLNIIRKGYEDQDNFVFIDSAVSGYKSDDVVMTLYSRVLNHKPTIAHILIGTNDLRRNNHDLGRSCISLNEYKSNICYIIQSLKNENVDIVISTIPPVINEKINLRFPNENWLYSTDDINECNEIIAQAAKSNGIKLNDMRPVYEKYKPEDLLLEDGLHLNCLGQTLLMQNVLIALSEFFN